MKKISVCILLIAAIFTSCSKDDDGGSDISEANLVGKWQWTASIENGKTDELDECDLKETNEYKANGELVNTYFYGGTNQNGEVDCSNSGTTTYKWSLSGDQLTEIYEGNDSDISTIIELTGTTLKIQYKYEEAGINYTSVDTFTRL